MSDQNAVVGLKRVRHVKALMYVLANGSYVHPSRYKGEHPTHDRLAQMKSEMWKSDVHPDRRG